MEGRRRCDVFLEGLENAPPAPEEDNSEAAQTENRSETAETGA